MTSSEERPSAEAEGHRIERSLMDRVAPLNPSVSSSIFLVAKGVVCFDRPLPKLPNASGRFGSSTEPLLYDWLESSDAAWSEAPKYQFTFPGASPALYETAKKTFGGSLDIGANISREGGRGRGGQSTHHAQSRKQELEFCRAFLVDSSTPLLHFRHGRKAKAVSLATGSVDSSRLNPNSHTDPIGVNRVTSCRHGTIRRLWVRVVRPLVDAELQCFRICIPHKINAAAAAAIVEHSVTTSTPVGRMQITINVSCITITIAARARESTRAEGVRGWCVCGGWGECERVRAHVCAWVRLKQCAMRHYSAVDSAQAPSRSLHRRIPDVDPPCNSERRRAGKPAMERCFVCRQLYHVPGVDVSAQI